MCKEKKPATIKNQCRMTRNDNINMLRKSRQEDFAEPSCLHTLHKYPHGKGEANKELIYPEEIPRVNHKST